MNRRNILASAGFLAAAAMAGCIAGQPGDGESPGGDDVPTGTGVPDPETAPEPVASDLETLVAGNTSFALALHDHLGEAAGGNLFTSPYSISMALAMVYAGADGETAREMEDVLGFDLGEDTHAAMHALHGDLADRQDAAETDEDQAFQLDIANALWGQHDFPFDEDYLDLIATRYGAGFQDADFTAEPEAERERIDAWVAEVTDGEIEELFPEGSIHEDTRLVLANAIYFLASWQHPFDPDDTSPAPFEGFDGATAEVPFMHRQLRANYAELDRARALELPYVGNDVSMVLVLPDEGAFEAVEADLDVDRLQGIFDALGDAEGEVYLPRFEVEQSVSLVDALTALGMPSAFTESAQLGGMHADGRDDLFIDEVIHDAVITVDEEGTEAAAATGVGMSIVSAPPGWGELRFDRPFLFLIRDRPTDAVLFMGRVVDLG